MSAVISTIDGKNERSQTTANEPIPITRQHQASNFHLNLEPLILLFSKDT